MRKLFFCIFITLFITLCVWLGLYGETYAYYTSDNQSHQLTSIVFDSLPSFDDLNNALKTYEFKDSNNNVYCTYEEISTNYLIGIDGTQSNGAVRWLFDTPSTINFSNSGTNGGLTYYTYSFNNLPHLWFGYQENTYTFLVYYYYNNGSEDFFIPKGLWPWTFPFNNNYNETITNSVLYYNNNEITYVNSLPNAR